MIDFEKLYNMAQDELSQMRGILSCTSQEYASFKSNALLLKPLPFPEKYNNEIIVFKCGISGIMSLFLTVNLGEFEASLKICDNLICYRKFKYTEDGYKEACDYLTKKRREIIIEMTKVL